VDLDEVAERSRYGEPGWVRVAIRAAGVSFVDALRSRGEFDCVPPLPFTLGLDVCGEVSYAPEGCGFSVGDRVVGYVRSGGFAEAAWVHSDMLAPLPSGLTFIEGAAIVVNYHTALLALWRRAQLCAGETVLVHGAGGGIGSAAVQISRALGAKVVAVAGAPARRQVAAAAGANCVCAPDEWYDAVKAVGGADVIIDPVGGDAFERNLRCLAPEGRLVTLGCASNVVSRVMSEHFQLRSSSLMGMCWPALLERDHSLFARTAKQLDGLISDGLRPIVTKSYDLADGADALRAMENRTAAGKTVLTVG